MSNEKTHDDSRIDADIYVRAMCRQATPEEVAMVRRYRQFRAGQSEKPVKLGATPFAEVIVASAIDKPAPDPVRVPSQTLPTIEAPRKNFGPWATAAAVVLGFVFGGPIGGGVAMGLTKLMDFKDETEENKKKY